MKKIKLVLLPGMDGTGIMFQPLVREIEKDFDPIVISYPQDRPLDYEALTQYVTALLPNTKFIILGESFSGPIAIKVADSKPKNLLGIILCATFIKNPMIVGVKKQVSTNESIVTAEIKEFTDERSGIATYYADYFHGRKTANGEIFDMNAMTTAATPSYSFGTILKVTNVENNKSVEVKVNDRGAFSSYGVALDLSKGAFEKISPLSRGVLNVKIEEIK